MSFLDGVLGLGLGLGITIPQESLQQISQRQLREVLWTEGNIKNYPYLLVNPIIDNPEYLKKEPENCRNCGSAHTRVKKGVTICAYCGSRTP